MQKPGPSASPSPGSSEGEEGTIRREAFAPSKRLIVCKRCKLLCCRSGVAPVGKITSPFLPPYLLPRFVPLIDPWSWLTGNNNKFPIVFTLHLQREISSSSLLPDQSSRRLLRYRISVFLFHGSIIYRIYVRMDNWRDRSSKEERIYISLYTRNVSYIAMFTCLDCNVNTTNTWCNEYFSARWT